jgi:hypothetical protein
VCRVGDSRVATTCHALKVNASVTVSGKARRDTDDFRYQ